MQNQRHKNLREKFKLEKITKSHTNSLYYYRAREEERTLQPLSIYNSIHTFLLYITLVTAHLLL